MAGVLVKRGRQDREVSVAVVEGIDSAGVGGRRMAGEDRRGVYELVSPTQLPPRLNSHPSFLPPPLPLTQGVAHFVEHVTFLGSKKRETLLGTGARANAYTDFHHTVFHVHAPVTNNLTGGKMLPQVGPAGTSLHHQGNAFVTFEFDQSQPFEFE